MTSQVATPPELAKRKRMEEAEARITDKRLCIMQLPSPLSVASPMQIAIRQGGPQLSAHVVQAASVGPQASNAQAPQVPAVGQPPEGQPQCRTHTEGQSPLAQAATDRGSSQAQSPQPTSPQASYTPPHSQQLPQAQAAHAPAQGHSNQFFVPTGQNGGQLALAEGQPAQSQPAQGQPAQREPAQHQPPETAEPENQPPQEAATQPAQAAAQEALAEGQPAQSQPAQGQPAQREPAQHQPQETAEPEHQPPHATQPAQAAAQENQQPTHSEPLAQSQASQAALSQPAQEAQPPQAEGQVEPLDPEDPVEPLCQVCNKTPPSSTCGDGNMDMCQ
jgi:hypothetical protein